MLHSMFRMRWDAWRHLSPERRAFLIRELHTLMDAWNADRPNQSGLFSMLGHKANLMLVQFRPTFEDLNRDEVALAKAHLFDYLEETTSYVSVVELGLYESTSKVYGGLQEQGLVPHSGEWKAGVAETLERQAKAMHPRLHPEIPASRYVCFYPMNRRRGEDKNWYSLPLAERAALMHEHGLVGRRYADVVKQIISGSIGFDDYEWGVTLFSDEALTFKKLIYEMRFDPVSAIYAEFGPFYFGLRLDPAAGDLERYFLGE